MKFKLSYMTFRYRLDVLKVVPTGIKVICYLFGSSTTLKNRNTISYLSSLGATFKGYVSVNTIFNPERQPITYLIFNTTLKSAYINMTFKRCA